VSFFIGEFIAGIIPGYFYFREGELMENKLPVGVADKEEEGLPVSFGLMFPDICPESSITAGYLKDGMFYTIGSVARHFWKLQQDINKNKRKERNQHVYFIQSIHGGPIKIGIAMDVASRLSELQIGNPYQLRIIGIIENAGKSREANLHAHFAKSRLCGEWFEESEELLEVIRNEARA
jgi:hypothetical protein